ncbi:hypothetical protein F0562_007478 [Nyssa sinensis]|uniref:Uncharacterized protein n=1 Tax=Nyssa sinensis TaxID=561372 RepID=A0A5J5A593_9ASTE|nr:hypothetical protein F0562_007478 [Nyssa sinensis]
MTNKKKPGRRGWKEKVENQVSKENQDLATDGKGGGEEKGIGVSVTKKPEEEDVDVKKRRRRRGRKKEEDVVAQKLIEIDDSVIAKKAQEVVKKLARVSEK